MQQLYFCEDTTQIIPGGQVWDQRGYQQLERCWSSLPHYFLSLTPHLNPQQMGSLGFQPRLGPTSMVCNNLQLLICQEQKLIQNEIVC